MPVVPFVTPESHRSHGSGAEWRKGWDCGKVWPWKALGRTSQSCRAYSAAESSSETRRNSRLTLNCPRPPPHTHTEMEKQDSSLSAGYELRTVFDIFYPSYLSDSLCKTSFDISGNCSSEKLGNVPRVTQPVNDWDRIDSKSTILFTLYEPFYITCDSTFQ